MIKRNQFKKYRFVFLAFFTVLFSVFAFQNCSPQKLGTPINNDSVNVNSQSPYTIQYSKTYYASGPDYFYDILYDLNLITQTIVLSVKKGPLTAINLTPYTKQMTPSQVSSILALYNNLKPTACDFMVPLGGGSNSFLVFDSINDLNSKIANRVLTIGNCGAKDSKTMQLIGEQPGLASYIENL